MLKSITKKVVALGSAVFMAMMSTNIVYASPAPIELNSACEISTELYDSPIERDKYISFESREDAYRFINQLYENLNNDEYEVISVDRSDFSDTETITRIGPGNPPCCHPDLPFTYHTAKDLTGNEAPALSAVYLNLYTDYYCECTDTSPNQPHKMKCKIITSTSASFAFSGLTFGLHTEDVTVTSRINSDKRGFQSSMRGTIVIGLDIGGIGEVARIPVSTNHAYVLPNYE